MEHWFRKPYVILVGPVGAGKSTLAQKLSVKQVQAGAQGFGWSATKQSTKYAAESFDFADTPGLRSRREKVDHAVNIICALHHRSISRIFVVTKYSERIDDFVNDVELIARPFHCFKDLLTVVVTHWDNSDQTENTKNQIKRALCEELGMDSVIYSKKDSSGKDIASAMRNTFSTPRVIKIASEDITIYFDLKKNDMQMIDYIRRKTEKYKMLVKKSMKKADDFLPAEASKKDDFLFYSQLALRDVIEQWKDDFVVKFLTNVTEPEEYASLDALNMSLRNVFRGYRAYCQQFFNFSESSDAFRKCPYPDCGQIWIKVEGCDGTTVCGARPSCGDRPKKTKWSWIIRDDDIDFSFVNVDFSHLTNINTQQRGTGCGRSITWKDMQPVRVDPIIFEVPEYLKEAQDIATTSDANKSKFAGNIDKKLNATKLLDKT